MSILITGVAGFIGTNLAQRFLLNGEKVIGIDNFSRGTSGNMFNFIDNPRFDFHELDLTDLFSYRLAVQGVISSEPITEVWHLAANSDIPAGIYNADVDLKDTFMTTFNTLKIMQEFKIKTLMFASSSAIYGDLGDTILVEDVGPLFPISNYGAMKLASEAIISAAVENYLDIACVFRFPNVVGVPATHGVILDFVHKLKVSTNSLQVLGDGTQQKSYLHVRDLINAMFMISERSSDGLHYYNIGAENDDGVPVSDIAKLVVGAVSPAASIVFGSGGKGWVGDVPKFKYSVEKIKALGWSPELDSIRALEKAINEIVAQESEYKE